MKKIFALLILAIGLSTSAFAVSISVGGNFNGGGTLSTDSQYQGFTAGGGAFLNLNLFLGLGVQAEVNVTTSKMTFIQNSVYVYDDYTIYDVPVMLWWNLRLGSIIVGAGAGLNISSIDNVDYYPVERFALGCATGANVIFLVGNHFGIVVGAHGVFDFTPHLSVTESRGGTVYTFNASNWTRSSVYGNIGLEYRF